MTYPLYNLLSGIKLLKCYNQSSIRVSSQCVTLGWLCCIALWIVDNV
ncbi:MAG: hypothetical protein ACR5LA_04115 [Wolbachia sp.]